MSAARFGIFGGMFDPPHLGHLAVIESVLELGPPLQELVVVVSGVPPHRDTPATDAHARLQMAMAAFSGIERVVVSAVEIEAAARGHVNFTVDTVAALAADRPGLVPALVVGGDQAVALDTWHRWRELSQQVEVIVVDREGSLTNGAEPDAPPRALHRVRMPPMPISSTTIRALLADGQLDEARRWVPSGVANLLEATYSVRTDV